MSTDILELVAYPSLSVITPVQGEEDNTTPPNKRGNIIDFNNSAKCFSSACCS